MVFVYWFVLTFYKILGHGFLLLVCILGHVFCICGSQVVGRNLNEGVRGHTVVIIES